MMEKLRMCRMTCADYRRVLPRPDVLRRGGL
jgi:hypothetical protein